MMPGNLLKISLSRTDSDVTVKIMVNEERSAKDAWRNLKLVIQKLRIDVNLEVIIGHGRSFDEVLQKFSENADLVLPGMASPDDNFVEYYSSMQSRISKLPATILVLAAEDFSFRKNLLQEDIFKKD